jgi:hypothetical protein
MKQPLSVILPAWYTGNYKSIWYEPPCHIIPYHSEHWPLVRLQQSFAIEFTVPAAKQRGKLAIHKLHRFPSTAFFPLHCKSHLSISSYQVYEVLQGWMTRTRLDSELP